MSSVDEIMASLLNSPAKSKGVVKVKYTATKKSEVKPSMPQTRQGRSLARTPSVGPAAAPKQTSLASQIMSARCSSTPSVPAPVSKFIPHSLAQETPSKNGRGIKFTDYQVKRLTEQLSKIPDMTAYFKKKVASQLSNEIGLSEKQIISWLSINQRKASSLSPAPFKAPISNTKAVLTPTLRRNVSEEEAKKEETLHAKSPVIKKETPDSVIALTISKPQLANSDDIECIEIDDDDDLLMNDSVHNQSVTIGESHSVPSKQTVISKAKANLEESSKDEILHLLMDQIKELEKYVQTNSSPELEKFKKQIKEKESELELVKKDALTNEERLQNISRKSDQQGQQFAKELKALKEEIDESKFKKSESSVSDSKALKVFKQRIEDLEKMGKNKEEEYFVLKNKLDLVENVANNKVQRYKEKLAAAEQLKSPGDSELKSKYECLQREYSEKVDVVKSLESRIPKMIEEFTKYVEEKDSLHIIKEKEFENALSDKQSEVSRANEKIKNLDSVSDGLENKNEEVKLLRQREKESKENTEKKHVEFIKTIEKKEKEILESQEKHRKVQNTLTQKSKEFQLKEKELLEKSNELYSFKEAQGNLNEKYKKLLMSKDKELDQAEKDSLELKERIKMLKDESKNHKTSDSKEIVEMKLINKKLKKENEKKDKELILKSKEITRLEIEVKEKSEKITKTSSKVTKLEEKNKTLGNAVAQADSNFQKQKVEITSKTDELTCYQIKTQKFTKLNNELKHQYNELNKMYNKSAADAKKQEKEVIVKNEELVAAQKAASVEKEAIEIEIKALKQESGTKEEKINKLLDVLVKRGDHIRELKAQDVLLNKKLKEKDDQYVDVVGRCNKKVQDKDADIENKTKEIEQNKKTVELRDQEIAEMSSNVHCMKQKLLATEMKIQDNTTKFMSKIQEKEKEVVIKNHQYKKDMQRMILDCNEKLDTKDQLLRNKALEHGRKLAEKTTELNEKINDKEHLLLKLNAKLFEKDVLISDKDDEIKNIIGRIQDMNKDFEKKMEDKVFADINTQNNIRHELLLQQHTLKKSLLNEQELLKQQLLIENESIKSNLFEEKTSLKLEHDEVKTNLMKKLNDKENLVKKLKILILFKPSENVGTEKLQKPSDSPPMALCFSWPLVHLFGSPVSVDQKSATFLVNDHLADLLQMRIAHFKHSISVVPQKTRYSKRKFDDDYVESKGSIFKKRRISYPVLMLTYSWPLVSCKPNPGASFLLNDNGVMVFKLRFFSLGLKDRLPKLMMNSSTEKDNLYLLSISPSPTPLMLTYSWPLVVCKVDDYCTFLINDLGAYMLKLRICSVQQIPELMCDTQVTGNGKRKIEQEYLPCSKKSRRESVCAPLPAPLMLSYSWPLVSYKKIVSVELKEFGEELLTKSQNQICNLPLKKETIFMEEKGCKKILMLCYSWPLVPVKRLAVECPFIVLIAELKNAVEKIISLKRQSPEIPEQQAKRLKLQESTSPCWPVVPYNPHSIGSFKVDETMTVSLSFADVYRNLHMTRSFIENLQQKREKRMNSLQCRYEIVAQNMISTQNLLRSQSVKRKIIHYSSDELEPERKKLKYQDMDEDLGSFYSYKTVRPTVKSRCISSPGLCSPRKAVKRKFNLPQDLKEMVEQNSNMDDTEVESSDDEEIEISFITPISKKTKCLSSPRLCNTFPKVTKRSFPSFLDILLDEETLTSCSDFSTEENGNNLFDFDVKFSTPKIQKTMCLGSPGLCDITPTITKRTFPASLNYLLGEEVSVENVSDVQDETEFEASFSTQTVKTKCTRTPGLCEDFPHVTARSLSLSLKSLFENDFDTDYSNYEEGSCYEELFEDDADQFEEDVHETDSDNSDEEKMLAHVEVVAIVEDILQHEVVDLLDKLVTVRESRFEPMNILPKKTTKNFRISGANRTIPLSLL